MRRVFCFLVLLLMILGLTIPVQAKAKKRYGDPDNWIFVASDLGKKIDALKTAESESFHIDFLYADEALIFLNIERRIDNSTEDLCANSTAMISRDRGLALRKLIYKLSKF